MGGIAWLTRLNFRNVEKLYSISEENRMRSYNNLIFYYAGETWFVIYSKYVNEAY